MAVTSSSSVVTTAAFDAAMASGDIETIQTYFSQPNVLAMTDETEARVVRLMENDHIDSTHYGRTMTIRDGARPWFRPPGRSPDEDAVPLVDAARCGYIDVIKWFFSRENARRMGATLTALLPLIASFRDRLVRSCPSACPSDPLVVEALLTSHVFCELLADGQKQRVLDRIVRNFDNPAVLEIAIAHGAELSTAASVITHYGVEALRDDMSFLLGADVLLAPTCFWKHADADDSFLVDDPENPLVHELPNAAAMYQFATFEAALREGFLDVDARDRDALTPLMHWADADSSDSFWEFTNPTVNMVELLLARGADYTLVDHNGRSALHYARDNEDVTKLLLERGADPTLPDAFGVMAFDWILDKVHEWYGWEEIIELCLQCGADPFVRRPRPLWSPDETVVDGVVTPARSLYDRLNENDSGKAFMRMHAQVFKCDGSPAAKERS